MTDPNSAASSADGSDPARHLASVRRVDAVEAIPEADAIEAAVVGGWRVVVRKGQFAPGDAAVYFEIDSLLPTADPRFAFLASRGTKTVPVGGVDVQGHVLRTIKLRGVYSQGLLLTLEELELDPATPVGTDLTSTLGVRKWEPPIPAGTLDLIGEFPTHLAGKTDAERVQNLVQAYPQLLAHPAGWIATEKIDGTSLTLGRESAQRGAALVIAARNWQVADDGRNVYSRAVAASGLTEALPPGHVIQAEVYGEGVQANPLKVSGLRLAVFAYLIYRVPQPRSAWPAPVVALAAPVYEDLAMPASVDEAIAQATKLKSLVSPQLQAEGIVWHTADAAQLPELEGRTCWKSINPAYLLKHGG
jgi:RNA ligase (TIGR02306 family)